MSKQCPKCGRFISKKDVESGELEMIDIGYDDTINYVPICRNCTDQYNYDDRAWETESEERAFT